MENQDKIYSQFKNAAEKSEVKDFPNMDKVWNRVEEKLDKKVLKKQNTLWKKIAVAASILLVASVGYQLLKPNEIIENPQSNIVIIDTIPNNTTNSASSENAIAIVSDSSSVIKKDADRILKKVIATQPNVAVAEINADSKIAEDTSPLKDNVAAKEVAEENTIGYMAKRKFEARGVQQNRYEESTAKEIKKLPVAQKKEEPLLVIDNKAVISKNAAEYRVTSDDEMSKIDPDDIQTVTYLKEPLYVIDGKQYTEEEMFGPNPTSPYFPLSEQEIKTTVVLLGKEAVKLYGKKGEKGVLVITTKYGKPLTKKVTKKP